MRDLAEKIREYMEREGLDQASLAEAAGVSQPTVSRVLSGSAPLRMGRAYRQLLAHIGITNGHDPSPVGKKRVARAFEKIWDGSEVHAAAVAQIIEGLAGLTPSRQMRRRFEQRKRA